MIEDLGESLDNPFESQFLGLLAFVTNDGQLCGIILKLDPLLSPICRDRDWYSLNWPDLPYQGWFIQTIGDAPLQGIQ